VDRLLVHQVRVDRALERRHHRADPRHAHPRHRHARRVAVEEEHHRLFCARDRLRQHLSRSEAEVLKRELGGQRAFERRSRPALLGQRIFAGLLADLPLELLQLREQLRYVVLRRRGLERVFGHEHVRPAAPAADEHHRLEHHFGAGFEHDRLARADVFAHAERHAALVRVDHPPRQPVDPQHRERPLGHPVQVDDAGVELHAITACPIFRRYSQV